MHENAECYGRFLSSPEQHQNQDSVRHVKHEQSIGCPGMTEQFGRVHPNCDEGRNRQKNARGSQPALDPPGFARIRREFLVSRTVGNAQ